MGPVGTEVTEWHILLVSATSRSRSRHSVQSIRAQPHASKSSEMFDLADAAAIMFHLAQITTATRPILRSAAHPVGWRYQPCLKRLQKSVCLRAPLRCSTAAGLNRVRQTCLPRRLPGTPRLPGISMLSPNPSVRSLSETVSAICARSRVPWSAISERLYVHRSAPALYWLAGRRATRHPFARYRHQRPAQKHIS
jgi:hypothetical protein